MGFEITDCTFYKTSILTGEAAKTFKINKEQTR